VKLLKPKTDPTLRISVRRRVFPKKNWLVTVDAYMGPSPSYRITRGVYGGAELAGLTFDIPMKSHFLEAYRQFAFDTTIGDGLDPNPVLIVVKLYESGGEHLTDESRVMTLVSTVGVDLVGLMNEYRPRRPKVAPRRSNRNPQESDRMDDESSTDGQ
jgi:hypothetical protein